MGLALRDANRYTYGDYRTWTDDTRWELIDGYAYALEFGYSRTHQTALGDLATQLANQLNRHHPQVFVGPFEVRLPRADESDDAIDTVVLPDIAVVCDPTKLDERGCRGAPDWVIEVLSPATAAHDHRLKRAVYERAGVLEYWLVHPTDRTVHVYRLAAGAYGKPDVYNFAGAAIAHAAPEVVVDLAQVEAALPNCGLERHPLAPACRSLIEARP